MAPIAATPNASITAVAISGMATAVSIVMLIVGATAAVSPDASPSLDQKLNDGSGARDGFCYTIIMVTKPFVSAFRKSTRLSLNIPGLALNETKVGLGSPAVFGISV